MKRFIMRKIFNITMLCSILAAVSCSDTVNDSSAENAPSHMDQTATNEKGSTTVRMFVPDYYALAEQGSARVIAPQSVSARLSYNIPNLGWIGVNTVKLADAEKTPVENAPDNFTGSVYTISFDGIPIGTYEAGNLMIELLNAAGTTITAGTSTTTVEITKGGKDSTTFYTLPQVSDSTTGNLAAGEMKFSLQMLYTGIVYKVSMTTSGDYPDIVMFSSDGKLLDYYPIDSAEDVAQIEVETTGQYYVGVWADDGNDIGRYSYSFGQLKYFTESMYAGIQYKAVVTTDGETYPDLIMFASDGSLLHYYTIANEAESHISINVTQGDTCTFILYGKENDSFNLSLGKLQFVYENMYAGIPYDAVVTTNGETYPDLVCFDSEGKLLHYYTIKNADEAHIKLDITKNDSYTFILYGNETDTYSLSLGKLSFTSANLVAGVPYNVIVNTSGEDYPDFILFDEDGSIVNDSYKKISSEVESHFILNVETSGTYNLGLYGLNPDEYSLTFDLSTGTSLKGVLTGTNLHWTKENSPYIVNANLLVEEGAELTIDPGVIVQFTGSYYISVNGTISAVGTKTEPIIFVQSGDNLNYWSGITIDSTTSLNVTDTYTYVSGNILKNCMVIGAGTPLTLDTATYVDSCTFTGNGNYVNVRSDSLLINNVLDSGVYAANSAQIVNNTIKGELRSCYAVFTNNTISNASIIFESWNTPIFKANTINACSFYIEGVVYDDAKFTNNNFIGYSGTILNVSNCSYKDRKSYNFTGNYWGEEQTAEIESKLGSNVPDEAKDYNMSFFTDYYDDFENTKIDFSNWATAPIEGAGYLGDGFIAFDYTINGYNYENGGYYPESTNTALSIVINPKYHANEISSIRIAQSMATLKETEWSAYSTNQSFTVDKTALVDGTATIYVQLKDSEGNVSSPVMHEVPFDKPAVTLSIADGTTYTSATSSVSLSYGATDKANLTQYELYLDDVKITSSETSSGWGKSVSWSYTLGLAYMSSGNHTLKLTFWDSARNSTTKEVTFTINRTVDTTGFAGTSFDTTSGQLLKDTNTVYLWHLDNNGSEADGDTSKTLSSYSAGTGGLAGYASYLLPGTTSIPLELNDNAFTVECWRKENNSFSIYKSDVFVTYSSYLRRYYLTAGGSKSYQNADFPSSLNDDNWHFWSYVYGGTYMAVYRDGVLITYRDGLSQTLNTNDNKLYVYCYNIDELRISRTARSADEIAAYYAVAKDLIQ